MFAWGNLNSVLKFSPCTDQSFHHPFSVRTFSIKNRNEHKNTHLLSIDYSDYKDKSIGIVV